MRLALVTDDMQHHAGVRLAQVPGGAIAVTVDTGGDPEATARQVRRILSLEW